MDAPSLDDETRRLLNAGAGAQEELANLFARYRPRLLRMIAFRLGPELQARVDAADVVQETWMEASQRLDSYIQRPNMPIFLWLRFLARQRLLLLRRHHLDRRQRDARREVPIRAGGSDLSTAILAAELEASLTSPSSVVRRDETRALLKDALDTMDPVDREIIALRHFEHLTNGEAARELELTEFAASKRYLRAVVRLRDVLAPLHRDLGPDRL
jgi:RNA polymerase sigma-70 factor (ECF subfamily)